MNFANIQQRVLFTPHSIYKPTFEHATHYTGAAPNTRSTYHRDYTATELIFSPNGIIRIGAQYLMHTNPSRFGITCVVTGEAQSTTGWIVPRSSLILRVHGAQAGRRGGAAPSDILPLPRRSVQPSRVGVNLDRRVGRSIRCDRAREDVGGKTLFKTAKAVLNNETVMENVRATPLLLSVPVHAQWSLMGWIHACT